MRTSLLLAVALGTVVGAVVATHGAVAHAAAGTLAQVTSFGANPGQLDMWKYTPPGAPANAPLVIFMHGCTQTAADATHTGWNELADEYGFHVVYPQQRSANNPVSCFNWAGEYGDPANLIRGQGENESIREMIDQMIADHGIDESRVFVAGFSAGGAFAAVMLATWPDLFEAGAIMSGVPFRCATTVNTAYSCQQLSGHAELKHTPAEWGDLVRAAHPGFAGPRPRVAIFHGANDYTVNVDAADESIEQWTNVLGADLTADEVTTIGMTERSRYQNGGTTVLEAYRVTGMGHAVAMGAADPAHGCPPMGGSYIEDRGLCSAYRAAVFFGLIDDGTPPGSDGGFMPPTNPDGGLAPPGAPTVTITSPGDGDTVSGMVTITASAADDMGIARVEFYVDGELKGSDGVAPYEQKWQTANYSDGSHEVEAIAYDLYEVSATHTVNVTVSEDGSGGNGADGLGPDPIPCGCAATGPRAGGVLAGALVQALLVGAFLLRRRGRKRRTR